ncbi:MAG: hypothetical protein KatS3mg107_0837 [Gemmataceae bacterium]|jgi:hypothetical protein|nr:MAG: hypothetical protein KatS3mg107_0837 [Gemmataceae bacterium]
MTSFSRMTLAVVLYFRPAWSTPNYPLEQTAVGHELVCDVEAQCPAAAQFYRSASGGFAMPDRRELLSGGGEHTLFG